MTDTKDPPMSEEPENFANHPKSLNEHRAGAAWDGRLWTPRDALIDLLREIDSGRLNVDAVVICFRARDPEGQLVSRFNAAGTDLTTALGLLSRVGFLMQERGP